MNNQEYEQKKRECWEEYTTISPQYKAFSFAFDRAYTLGKEKEAITLEEIEKAADEFADKEYMTNQYERDALYKGYYHGMKDALGKQEKDATMQQDYKSGELECWCDFCNTEIARRNSFDRALVRAANNFAFFRGYRLCKQEKEEDTVISGWLCRDKVINEPFTSDLFLAFDEPTRIEEWGKWGDMGDYIELDSSLFPDLTWDSDPLEVEIIIKRKKK